MDRHTSRLVGVTDGPSVRRRVLVLASAVALTVLASSSPLVQSVRAQGDCELGGDLNFIGWAGEDGPDVAGDWLAENDITVNATYAAAAEDPLTAFNTGQRGTMDLIAYNKDFGNTVLNAGIELFAPIDLSRVPNAEALFPAL